MTSRDSDEDDGEPDILTEIREELRARSDVGDFVFHDVTAKSVEVEIEEFEDGNAERYLYRIEKETRPDGEENLHWVLLGNVQDPDRQSDRE